MRWSTSCVMVLGVAFMLFAVIATAGEIPFGEVTYVYPLDIPPVGPNQGDSAQPRSDIRFYGDANGDTLSNGIFPSSFPSDSDPDVYVVGFNEYHGSGSGVNTGDPQPRIEFALGGSRSLESVAVNYFAGGPSGIVGPTDVEISYSYDGGVTYSASPDVIYSGFDRTDEPTPAPLYPTGDMIDLGASGVTDVRMDFFQGNYSQRENTSAWVFLGEVTFYEGTASDGLGSGSNDILPGGGLGGPLGGLGSPLGFPLGGLGSPLGFPMGGMGLGAFPIPEPSAFLLFCIGVVCVVGWQRRTSH